MGTDILKMYIAAPVMVLYMYVRSVSPCERRTASSGYILTVTAVNHSVTKGGKSDNMRMHDVIHIAYRWQLLRIYISTYIRRYTSEHTYCD